MKDDFEQENVFVNALENRDFDKALNLVNHGLNHNYYLYRLPISVSYEIEEYNILRIGMNEQYPSVLETSFLIDIGAEINYADFKLKTALDYASNKLKPHPLAKELLISKGAKHFCDLSHFEKLMNTDFLTAFANFDVNDLKYYIESKKAKGPGILPIKVVQALSYAIVSDPLLKVFPHTPNIEKINFLFENFDLDFPATLDLHTILSSENHNPYLRKHIGLILEIFAKNGLDFNDLYRDKTSLDLIIDNGLGEYEDLIRHHGGKTFAELLTTGRLKERSDPLRYLSQWEVLPE